MSIKRVEVLGCPVGNLWDVFVNDTWVARVTYHGNTLVRVKGILPLSFSKADIELAIDKLYN